MFRSHKDVAIQPREVYNKNKVQEGYLCDLCGQGPWANEIDVDIHRKHSHKWDLLKALKDDDIHMCSICLRVQKDKEALIEHILVNHLCCSPNATRINREIFICDHCNRLFFNKQLLITHIYHWHTVKPLKNQKTKTNCPKCWKMIWTKSAWFHLLYHGAFSVSTCPICLENCENRSELLQHLKSHTGYFCCNICAFETTKECYLNNHLAKHSKNVVNEDSEDVSRFFLPRNLHPSLNNCMHNVFKGIPLANEVRLCILCRALCMSEDEMRQHILGEHRPEQEQKSKVYVCTCRKVFFNNILLKHHVFKMKGNHRAWDGVSPLPAINKTENKIVLELYELNNDEGSMANEIVIRGIPNREDNQEIEDSESQNEEPYNYEELEAMET